MGTARTPEAVLATAPGGTADLRYGQARAAANALTEALLRLCADPDRSAMLLVGSSAADLQVPGRNGFEYREDHQTLSPHLRTYRMTAETRVSTMTAADLCKPFDALFRLGLVHAKSTPQPAASTPTGARGRRSAVYAPGGLTP